MQMYYITFFDICTQKNILVRPIVLRSHNLSTCVYLNYMKTLEIWDNLSINIMIRTMNRRADYWNKAGKDKHHLTINKQLSWSSIKMDVKVPMAMQQMQISSLLTTIGSFCLGWWHRWTLSASWHPPPTTEVDHLSLHTRPHHRGHLHKGQPAGHKMPYQAVFHRWIIYTIYVWRNLKSG